MSSWANKKRGNNCICKYYYNQAFTIVELLIVIVIIGILAAITIVSYTGITKKANEANIQSEITNASKKLAMYYAQYGEYPHINSTTGCPDSPSVIDNSYCLRFGSGNAFSYTYKTSKTYDLTLTKSDVIYRVTENSPPTNISLVTTPVTAIGSVTGTTQTGQTLIAGGVTPAGANVIYQWQSATSVGGPYTDISSAQSNTYKIAFSNASKYIRVSINGTGSYSGAVTSPATSIVTIPDWVAVGSQVWAGSNLNTGNTINSSTDQTNNGIVEKYCYNNDSSSCAIYGGMYSWQEAMQYITTESTQGICPVGSRIPSKTDWDNLIAYYGNTTAASNALKVDGSSNLNMTLSGGYRSDFSFTNLDSWGFYWSSTSSSGAIKMFTMTNSGYSSSDSSNYLSDGKLSTAVRCIKN